MLSPNKMKKKRVRLIHWKPAEAEERADILRRAGYDVSSESFGQAAFKEMRASPPDAVVIDLSRIPSQGRDVGLGIRQYKDTRHVPLVFVEGDPDKVKRVRELLPDAGYTTWDGIRGVLTHAISHPLKAPVVPSSAMAGYEGAPLPKKLGIGPGAVVYLIDAPEGFEQKEAQWPDGVSFVRKAPQKNDLAMWFVLSRKELEKRIDRVKPHVGKGGLWIAWPKKASSVNSDLTQAVVRKAGLDSGLVDYKVCSIDKTWSGLKFAVRAAK
jgi:CheY-like chemotaxis protein